MIFIVYKVGCNTKKRTDILSTTIKEKAYKVKEDLEKKSKLIKDYDIAMPKAEKE